MLKKLIGEEVAMCVKFVSWGGYDSGALPETYYGVVIDVDEHFCKLELTAGKNYRALDDFKKVTGGTLYVNINDIAYVYVV